MANTSTPKASRRFSLIRLFNNTNNNNGSTTSPKAHMAMETISDQQPPVPTVPAHYRHSMAPSMDVQNELLRERRKSIAVVTDSAHRSLSLDLPQQQQQQQQMSLSSASHTIAATRGTKTGPVEMNEKMRQFDELLQKRRGSTIRISLTPSLLQESS
ncbi:hypothetical protein BGZ94_010050 [Podila epigama]|nr:hypothetical protein BGZ94_010050 [Podila epigama]